MQKIIDDEKKKIKRPKSEQTGYEKPKLIDVQNGNARRFRASKRFKFILPQITRKQTFSPCQNQRKSPKKFILAKKSKS